MIQYFQATFKTWGFDTSLKCAVPLPDATCILEMNPRGNLEMIEAVILFPDRKFKIRSFERGKRIIFNREGVCISHTPSWKHLSFGNECHFPKVIDLKNLDTKYPNYYRLLK